jgi:hypothetical protein
MSTPMPPAMPSGFGYEVPANDMSMSGLLSNPNPPNYDPFAFQLSTFTDSGKSYSPEQLAVISDAIANNLYTPENAREIAAYDPTRYNANAFNPMYKVVRNSDSPTGYSRFMKPVNADGSAYNPSAPPPFPRDIQMPAIGDGMVAPRPLVQPRPRPIQQMPQPMPVAPMQMTATPRDIMFNQQAMGGATQPMPPMMPTITPSLPAQITPMAMQAQAPMENLQPMSSRFDQELLSKLISSVPVRRRRKK